MMGFGLENLILFAITPVGFILLSSLLIFLEYIVGKSIQSDPNRINFRKVFNYIENYRIKDVSITPSQWTILDLVFKNKNISINAISKNTGGINSITRKLMYGLLNDGYIMRKINIFDKRAFCYATSDKYERQRRYNI